MYTPFKSNLNGRCIVDVETTGLQPFYGATTFAYCITYGNELIINRKDRDPDYESTLRQVLDDDSIVKVGHNIKFDYTFFCKDFNGKYNMPLGCTMLMSQILFNIEVRHGMDYLINKYCNTRRFDEVDRKVEAIGKRYGYETVPVHLFDKYQYNDAVRSIVLDNLLYPEICKDEKLYNVYNREIDLIKVTVDMERNGINLSVPNTERLLQETSNKFKQTQLDTYKYLGGFVNLHSEIQIHEILFNKYNLPILGKTKTGMPVQDKDALLEYKARYPNLKILDLIIQWRTYQNSIAILNSYLKDYLQYGKIHTTIKQNEAVTGRQSSSKPNLHNVQKKEALKNLYPVNNRLCFIPDTGDLWLLFDYKGIEIRLITEVTKEEIYYDFIVNNTGDPHTYAAEVFFGDLFTNEGICIDNLHRISENIYNDFVSGKISRQEAFKRTKKLLRDAAKNGQFAIAYGAKLIKLCKTLNLSRPVLEPGYINYGIKLPKIFNYTKETIKQVMKDGFIRTPYGRKLYANPYKPYVLSNAVIQSTAADILKDGERNVYKYIKTDWKKLIKMVLTVHDELIISIKKTEKKHIPEIIYGVSKCMTDIDKNIIKIPMEVSCKMTEKTWSDAEEIEI